METGTTDNKIAASVAVIGTLKRGMKIGDTVHKTFSIRELTVQDMIEAEKTTSAHNVHAFNVEQLCRALVSVGTYTGPFSPALIGRLSKSDYFTMLEKMNEADSLGEEPQEGLKSS